MNFPEIKNKATQKKTNRFFPKSNEHKSKHKRKARSRFLKVSLKKKHVFSADLRFGAARHAKTQCALHCCSFNPFNKNPLLQLKATHNQYLPLHCCQAIQTLRCVKANQDNQTHVRRFHAVPGTLSSRFCGSCHIVHGWHTFPVFSTVRMYFPKMGRGVPSARFMNSYDGKRNLVVVYSRGGWTWRKGFVIAQLRKCWFSPPYSWFSDSDWLYGWIPINNLKSS